MTGRSTNGVNPDPHAAEAIAAARRIGDPFSQAIALDYAALLHAFQGDSRGALERGREAVELCVRHRFAYYLAMGSIMTGWAVAAEGEVASGLAQLREGMETFRALGAELRLPYYYSPFAEILGRAERAGEALASLSRGSHSPRKTAEQWPVAELFRVQGELLAAKGKTEPAQASILRGIEAARQSGSLAFERKLLTLVGQTASCASTERF
jgi:adenylate cyclase